MPTPVLSDYLPGLLVQPVSEFEVVWRWDAIVRGFLFTGTFPVFPWIIFPLIGFVVGRRITAQRLQRDLPWLLAAAIAFIGLGFGLAYSSLSRPGVSVVSEYIAPLSFYPDSFTMMLCQVGISLGVFLLLYDAYDIRGRGEQPGGFVTGLFMRRSRFSLTFYFLHYLIIGWSLAVVFLLTGEYLIFDLTGAWPALFCGVTAVAFLELLIGFWERRGGRYSLEWILAMLTARYVRA